MDLEKFYEKITESLPAKRHNSDFRKDIGNALNEYVRLIKNLDIDVTNKIKTWADTLKRIEILVAKIKDCVKVYYEGQYSTAFTILKNQLLGYTDVVGIFDCVDSFEIKKDDIYFRARSFQNNRHIEHKEMFHIPLEYRGIVKTQRYSSPGYPCLYLGTTTYACWEELQQPKFDDLMFSALKAQKNIKLIDLRIPTKKSLSDIPNLHNILLQLPLIISCSFIVKETTNSFKAEYIIPQLLIENIINIKNKSKKDLEDLVLGVIYTSTHVNNDFGFDNSVFNNIAIPILDVSNSLGFCKILSTYFNITTPKCYEYEEMREEFGISVWGPVLTPEEEIKQKYDLSKMGKLEDRIKSVTYHPLT